MSMNQKLPGWLLVLSIISAPLAGFATYSSQNVQNNTITRDELHTLLTERDQRLNQAITNLDDVLQRETRLLDDAIKERIAALEKQSDLQLQQNNDLLSQTILSLRESRDRINQLEIDNARLQTEIQNLKER